MNIHCLKKVFFAVLFLFNVTAFAVPTIEQVKNDKVLISLDGTFTQVGDEFFGINAEKKKTSILEITTIKNDRAVAKVIKGTPQPKDTIEIKMKVGLAAKNQPKTPQKKPTFIRHDLKKMAINLKISTDTISTKQQDASNQPQQETVDMKGNNFGINVSLDLPWQDWFDVRGYVGYEMLKVTATAKFLSCDGKTSTDCNASINYLAFGGIGRFKYIKNNIVFWGGLGLGFKQPIGKKSTALTEQNIALANTAIFALGLDYHVNNQYFIPLSFEYHKSFNESDTVPTIGHSGILFGFGYLF